MYQADCRWVLYCSSVDCIRVEEAAKAVCEIAIECMRVLVVRAQYSTDGSLALKYTAVNLNGE